MPFKLHVNDEKRQDSNTSFLIFDIPRLIEFASTFYTLYPGDLYYTGTPEGVGPVKPGDWISLKSLPQLGELKIQVQGAPEMIDIRRARPRDLHHARSRAAGRLLFRRARPDRDRARQGPRVPCHPHRAGSDRARARRRSRADAAVVPGRARRPTSRAFARKLSEHGIKSETAQRHFARRGAGAGVHRPQGHGDRALFRLSVRQGRRQAGRHHAAQARPRRAPRRRRAEDR